ncbi:MAG: CDP-diacylglycerol--serine O-phosphatidyltransferase [Muribaculum sp.]|nr:CDP-diacylglycerol--serine O-phosphatidyltransferase [Muribaculaceae bacterium]MCM1080278.1 CDP-diacylglycerol--serine O-phosphatidyltransferase [Muribaculum sp.]
MKLPFLQHIPNAITCTSLFMGCVAIVAALNYNASYCGLEGYQWAYVLILIAAVCDFCDGAVARLLHAYSALGKELDSLSDLVSFGVAPGMLVFGMMSNMEGCPDWLPLVAFYIPVAGELRLARFNIDDRQTTSFLGMPIPANAIFWIGFTSVVASGCRVNPWFCAALVVIIASLMLASRLKMFSLKFKNFGFAANYMRYILIVAAIAFVAAFGLGGLAWTIALYIVLSVIPTTGGKG